MLGRAPVVITDPGPEPLDETLFNPIGFRRDWDRGVVDLDPSWTATPGLIVDLRDAQGVRIPPDADERVVAALAMSGVPLVTGDDQPDLDDPRLREEHSDPAAPGRAPRALHRRLAPAPRPQRAGVRVAAEGDVVLIGYDEGRHHPEVRTDLHLARRYSGADVVEMPTRSETTECFVEELVGGPVLIDRALLGGLGGLWLSSVGSTPYGPPGAPSTARTH